MEPSGFKFLASEYAESAVDRGSIKISLLSYFRELKLENSLIPDSQEGRFSANLVDYFQSGGKFNPIAAHNLKTPGFSVYIENAQEVSGSIYVDHEAPEYYIYCLSRAAGTDALSSGEGLDAVIRIDNLVTFGERIQAAYPDVLGPPIVGDVVYRDKVFDMAGEEVPWEADVFYKDKKFSNQNEIRVCWPALDYSRPFLITELPAIKNLMTRLK